MFLVFQKRETGFNALMAFILLLISCTSLKAQTQDSSQKENKAKKNWEFTKDLFSWKDPHSPKKASIYAAVVPGLGHIYNRKYWKVPIVWAAMGGVGYYTFDNARKMRKINDTLRSFYIKYNDTMAANPLHLQARNRYRQQRDMGILAFSALYVLQIIDATVDAHFYKLDLNQDLSARLRPNPNYFFTLTWKINGSNSTAKKIPGRYPG